MRSLNRQCFVLFLSALLVGPFLTDVRAEDVSEPGKRVRSTIHQVRTVVVDGKKRKMSVDQIDAKLRDVISPVFHFERMARSCLGSNWKKGTSDERQEFTELFTELLASTYLDRIKLIDEAEVNFKNETIHDGFAVIRTDVEKDGSTFPIHYRMKQFGEQWRVYDVIIENISLVGNYRGEFASIIRKEKFSGLIDRLKKKSKKVSES